MYHNILGGFNFPMKTVSKFRQEGVHRSRVPAVLGPAARTIIRPAKGLKCVERPFETVRAIPRAGHPPPTERGFRGIQGGNASTDTRRYFPGK